MRGDLARHPALERRLAWLLRSGTWLGSLVITTGLIQLWNPAAGAPPKWGSDTITLGVAIFLFLPILRVALMMAVFLHDRDYRFAAIALLVLVIIAAGAGLGMYLGVQGG
jgi:uncharacterized membrane protein